MKTVSEEIWDEIREMYSKTYKGEQDVQKSEKTQDD